MCVNHLEEYMKRFAEWRDATSAKTEAMNRRWVSNSNYKSRLILLCS